MTSLKQKVYDWKDRLKDRHMLTLVIVLIATIVILGLYTYKKQIEYRQVSENAYNMAFYELVDYVDSVEIYLAKSLVSNTPEHGAETLTYVWREANLAQSYLARLPISSVELENTAKFLNQVSDYSYSLSRKNINNESLTQEDLDNLTELHTYSVDLKNTLNQLSSDLNSGRISWGELTKKGSPMFAQEVSNITKDSFTNLEENFHEYAGLIYDGAFSEHMTNPERKGLTGEEISEETAKQRVEEFIGKDNIKELNLNGLTENANIQCYDFSVVMNNENNAWISVSKKGGHIVLYNSNRDIEVEMISQENANDIGLKFLEQRGIENMKPTYFIKQNGIVTINYAYLQDDVVVYSDLVKLKVALDNGEVLGMETSGYLNSHEYRSFVTPKISIDEAKDKINKKLDITSEGLAMIPTEFQTEILCWEFKGKLEDRDFLVYINVENGKEEDVLVILDTPNGVLTM
ncbi:MAG: germination protein YpeB [Clostridiales bacterium]|nr:germination protein YpeB [Clostridiales bacterium]